jgi:hypothetical protein
MNRADVSIPTLDELGDYLVSGTKQIDCSIAGAAFFVAATEQRVKRGKSTSFYEKPVVDATGSWCVYTIIDPCTVKCRPFSGKLYVDRSLTTCLPTERWVTRVTWCTKAPWGPLDYKCQPFGYGQSMAWTGPWPMACGDQETGTP